MRTRPSDGGRVLAVSGAYVRSASPGAAGRERSPQYARCLSKEIKINDKSCLYQ